jgi:hypothetical protein
MPPRGKQWRHCRRQLYATRVWVFTRRAQAKSRWEEDYYNAIFFL